MILIKYISHHSQSRIVGFGRIDNYKHSNSTIVVWKVRKQRNFLWKIQKGDHFVNFKQFSLHESQSFE